MSKHRAGRPFLQIPGPTNVPDRVLRAIDNPTLDIAARTSAGSVRKSCEVCGLCSKPRVR